MPKPKPPCRIDTVTFPLFGMSWFANPGDGTSIMACCGGGGSAKTGVKNFIYVREPGSDDVLEISTGDDVGVAIKVFQNPVTGRLWLVVAMGKRVQRYSLPEGAPAGKVEVGENCDAVAINAMADRLAVGCESGIVKVYSISDDALGEEPLAVCEGHTKAVCAVAFSPRGGKLVSSAKDGTAALWKGSKRLARMECSVADSNPRAPKPKRPPQVLVRGCAFGDLDGNLIYTVASDRRGKAYLYKWIQTPEKVECAVRKECSAVPVSAMSLSGDGGLMVLGSVDGSIILWSVENFKPLRVFKEVHDLPVTCIAARPFPVPLQGEEDGIQMHAVSASADSQMAWLTLQTKVPKQNSGGSSGLETLSSILNSLPRLAVIFLCFYVVAMQTKEKCLSEYGHEPSDFDALRKCIYNEVLIAEATRPGIMAPPY